MLKKFLNTASPTSLMLWQGEGGEKSAVELAREAIAKNTIVAEKEKPVKEEKEPDKEEDNEEEENDEDEDDEENDEEEQEEETAEAKIAREAREADDAKEKRKSDRIQKRIDKAVAGQRIAEAEILKLKEQLAANPDKKLTEAEVQTRAEAIAAEKVAAQNLEQLQKEFVKNCDKLQDAAEKIDKEFTPKVKAMAEELGAIPYQVINILNDLDNGANVLKYLVDDIDEAEKVYDLAAEKVYKLNPEKLAIKLVRISDKLAEADKPKAKVISKVPNNITPVNGSRVASTTITGKESTEDYVKKRTVQIKQRNKERGIV